MFISNCTMTSDHRRSDATVCVCSIFAIQVFICVSLITIHFNFSVLLNNFARNVNATDRKHEKYWLSWIRGAIIRNVCVCCLVCIKNADQSIKSHGIIIIFITVNICRFVASIRIGLPFETFHRLEHLEWTATSFDIIVSFIFNFSSLSSNLAIFPCIFICILSSWNFFRLSLMLASENKCERNSFFLECLPLEKQI